MYFAHSSNDTSKGDWQPLAQHLSDVAELAALFAGPCGCERAGRIAGLLHDLGKYDRDFQRRLDGDDIRVEHSIAGAALILSLADKPREKPIAELVAHAIAGHHAGLPDRIGDASSLNERLQRDNLSRLDPAWRSELAIDLTNLTPAISFRNKEAAKFGLSFLGRMLFSCLVDADFKDTEAFYNRIEGATADREWPELQAILPGLIDRADAELASKAAPGRETPVNSLRQRVLAHVRCKAAEAPGLFTLTVPTGGGKTLASLAFALDHARAHGMHRIIYAIPFTSVIDQTAGHFPRSSSAKKSCSNTIPPSTRRRRIAGRARDKLRLAMEDWAAPDRRDHQCAVVRKPVRKPPVALPQAAQPRQRGHHSG